MQIAEIVEKGPFDHSRTKVKAGCIIEKINGEEITPDKDITDLLNNKAGKKTLVSLYNPQSKERWEEVVIPVTNGQLNGLLYKRWVKQRAEDVRNGPAVVWDTFIFNLWEMEVSVLFTRIFWENTITVTEL